MSFVESTKLESVLDRYQQASEKLMQLTKELEALQIIVRDADQSKTDLQRLVEYHEVAKEWFQKNLDQLNFTTDIVHDIKNETVRFKELIDRTNNNLEATVTSIETAKCEYDNLNASVPTMKKIVRALEERSGIFAVNLGKDIDRRAEILGLQIKTTNGSIVDIVKNQTENTLRESKEQHERLQNQIKQLDQYISSQFSVLTADLGKELKHRVELLRLQIKTVEGSIVDMVQKQTDTVKNNQNNYELVIKQIAATFEDRVSFYHQQLEDDIHRYNRYLKVFLAMSFLTIVIALFSCITHFFH